MTHLMDFYELLNSLKMFKCKRYYTHKKIKVQVLAAYVFLSNIQFKNT